MRCDNRQNRTAEAKEAAYGGRLRRLQGGPGRLPLHTGFRKGQSGNPGGRSKKKLHALLAACSASPHSAPISAGPRTRLPRGRPDRVARIGRLQVRTAPLCNPCVRCGARRGSRPQGSAAVVGFGKRPFVGDDQSDVGFWIRLFWRRRVNSPRPREAADPPIRANDSQCSAQRRAHAQEGEI
jgi:hypothetical protein